MRIALVHLVRKQNPPEAFTKFWKSYVDHAAGMDHDVIIVWKNFIGANHPNIPDEVNVHHVVVSDQGCDIDVYFKVSKMFDHDIFVFLNSWSEIIKDGWMKTMHDAMRDEVGLVGAFSSLFSHRTNFLSALKKVWMRNRLWERALLPVYACYLWFRLEVHIPVYPNFHVRTNGFMIRREVMLQIHKPVLFDKKDALKFESGYNSLTRQVQRMKYGVACLDEHKLIVDNLIKSR